MSLFPYIKAILTWAGIVCAFIAACFWFKASTVVVNDPNNVHDPRVELRYKDKRTGKDVFVVATAMEQSRINRIAAILTGLAVLLQAVAAALLWFDR
jgi:hypothetical protein